MFRMIENVLSSGELATLREIAARARFVDGRASAVGSPVKNNLEVDDRAAHEKSSQMMADALFRNDEFRAFAFPKAMSPPWLTRYDRGMGYGIHADAAFMPTATRMLRSDLSCTIFLSDADDYEGGALRVALGTQDVRIKGAAGSAVIYPSTTVHEVEEVTSGSRLVGLLFIESRIARAEQREWLAELFEIMGIAGPGMDIATFTRLQRVGENLLRHWGDPS